MNKYELHTDVKRLTQEHPAFTGESNIPIGGWIYILHIGGDFYKIGSTRNMSKRIRAFQVSNPFIIGEESIVAAIPIHEQEVKQNRHQVLERRLHKFCRKQLWELDGWEFNNPNKSRSNASELFRMTPENLETLLDHIVTLRGYKYLRGLMGTALSRSNVRPILEWENNYKQPANCHGQGQWTTGLLERTIAEGL